MRQGRTEQTRIRVYPLWKKGAEEAYLEKKAAKGFFLKEKAGFSAYIFEKGEPGALAYAVSTRAEGEGWTLLFTRGRYSYFAAERAGDLPPHPSSKSAFEKERLTNCKNNLWTAAFLNLPGTLYCLLYIALYVTNGLFLGDLLEHDAGAAAFLALGIFSIAVFAKWALAAGRRQKALYGV